MTNDLVPDAVTRLPTQQNGGVILDADGTMSVRYEIREDAVWADGTPISGDDFEFTLETILDPVNNANTTIYRDIIEFDIGAKTFEYTLEVPTIQYQLL